LSLTVLSVAFPLAPVTADPVGGAEQVLSQLDRAVLEAGGRSVVVAAEGSSPAGRLLAVPQPAGEIDTDGWAEVHEAVRRRIAEAIVELRPDVVHMHGIDFAGYLPRGGPPVLVTLHLPLAWYPPEVLQAPPGGVWLAPVSGDQARRGPVGARLIPPIENGVEVEAFPSCRKRAFAIALGRICPEKGFHLALDAARRAGVPLLLAGAVFPYPEHRRYFDEEIRPRLDGRRRWIGPVGGEAKRRLLAAARCLLAPSLAPETSSLVAREALAAGTPVVALRAGALAETIEPGRTGVLVDHPEGLADGIADARRLDPEECRGVARARFPAGRMTAQYLEAYGRLAAGQPLELAAPEACA
jgi:glycosyltransferase involved in cell wall biosynthesis